MEKTAQHSLIDGQSSLCFEEKMTKTVIFHFDFVNFFVRSFIHFILIGFFLAFFLYSTSFCVIHNSSKMFFSYKKKKSYLLFFSLSSLKRNHCFLNFAEDHNSDKIGTLTMVIILVASCKCLFISFALMAVCYRLVERRWHSWMNDFCNCKNSGFKLLQGILHTLIYTVIRYSLIRSIETCVFALSVFCHTKRREKHWFSRFTFYH